MANWFELAMNGYAGGLADMMSGRSEVLLFVSLIMILVLGGWVAGIIATSGSSGGNNKRYTKNAGQGFRGTYLSADRRGRGVHGAHEGMRSGRVLIKRRLIIEGLEQDLHGRVGERVLAVLEGRFARGMMARLTGSKFLRGFEVITGLGGARRDLGRDSAGRLKAGNGSILKPAFDDGLCLVDITLGGQVEGHGFGVRLFPPGPVVQELSGGSLNDGDEGYVADEVVSPFFDCFDFPLLQLKGLTVEVPQGQELLLSVAVGGMMGRGVGLDQQIISVKEFCEFGRKLSARLEHNKLTQPELHEEMIVGAGWCFLIAGLLLEDLEKLKKALVLFGRAEADYWRSRDVTEWAGIKCNEAMAALALAQLHKGDVSRFYQRVQDAAIEGMRYFRRDNFPDSWGKLMCKLALSHGNMSHGRIGNIGNNDESGEAEFSSSLDYRPIVKGLDEAIGLWAARGHEGAICEAYYAKGRLAQNTAKLHMGIQDWERAENSFLAALALSDDVAGDVAGRFSCGRILIHYELGQLYLGWGTRFGERGLLEKAIHHFNAVQGCAGKSPEALELVRDSEFALAQCYLNFGGITNEDVHHKRAIFILNNLLDREGRGERIAELDRALCVARARLALNRRDSSEAKVAISAISAVIGQKNQSWPSADVLLRLRARLREMLFTLEGDDVALDRAIQDRRLLVASASEGLKDLRWAVEVGNLVGVLSQRQYKIDGQLQDFNEAHYFLEKAIAICEESSIDDGVADHSAESADIEQGRLRFDIPHIRGGLYLKLARLLASFARVQFDEPALLEAVSGFDKFLSLTPRSANALGRASALNDIGQIMMDRSEHYGHHDGLCRAAQCFAEAHDIYLEAERMDQANRMRRFMENAEAAILAYQVPVGSGSDGDFKDRYAIRDDAVS